MIYQNFQRNTSTIISSAFDAIFAFYNKAKTFYCNLTNKWNFLLFDHREYRFLRSMLLKCLTFLEENDQAKVRPHRIEFTIPF